VQCPSLQAQADNQRFLVVAAYLTLTSNVAVAAIQGASLRGQIEATNKLIDINSKMLEIMRRQFMEGYSNRSDVAAQEAALAQVKATLPPLRKALAQQIFFPPWLAGFRARSRWRHSSWPDYSCQPNCRSACRPN
jgi:outer membrane protein TolC